MTEKPEASAEMVDLLLRSRIALDAMMNAWFDYHDTHSLTQPVTGAAGNAFDLAFEARKEIDAALASLPDENAKLREHIAELEQQLELADGDLREDRD